MPSICAGQSLRVVVTRLLSIAGAVACLGVTIAAAAEAGTSASRKSDQAKQPATTVEMFAGMKNGDIDVKFIAMDSTRGNVMIQNKTKKPLSVKLPDAFAAVPVLAQRGRAGGLGGGGGIGGQGGMNQSMGGGMGGMGGGMMGGGGMGGGMMGGGGMGGFMNIPAEKTAKFKVPLVCLEHGKPDPRASVPYELKPIESFTQNTSVQQLCSMLGYGNLNQRVAQVAAWNLTDGMSFEQLAAKQLEVLGSPPQPYFSQQEVQAAVAVVNQAAAQAAQVERASKEKSDDKATSPGEQRAAKQADAEKLNDESVVGDATADAPVVKPAARRKTRSR